MAIFPPNFSVGRNKYSLNAINFFREIRENKSLPRINTFALKSAKRPNYLLPFRLSFLVLGFSNDQFENP